MANEQLPKTCAEARALGLNRYFTGKPCKNGHVSPRKVSHNECLVCSKNAIRNWRRAHADRVNEQNRARYYADLEKGRKQKRDGNKRRRRENPDKARIRDKINNRAGYARRKGAIGKYSQNDIDRIREQQKDRCAYCRMRLRGMGHVDHIVALSSGGINWPRNLQLLCAGCNCSKKASDPIDFAKSMGMLI